MSDEIAEQDLMQEVVKRKLMGRTDLQIARDLNIKRVQVQTLVSEWREIALRTGAKEKAQDRLYEMDESFQLQIRELWDNVQDLKDKGEYKAVSAAIGKIADIENKRFEALQKVGLYDDAELGDMLAQQQEQAHQIEQMLQELTVKFPETKAFVIDRLRKIFRKDELQDPDIIEGDIA